ncbi:MAG: DUF4914 family protein [Candidatus Omnitrophica bacterium]|nr:DUF4914 family protein [Candidatus Omnitrophota bacterium]MCB9719669.1 DUF4914 family protein [Candidatus Omnitrophota bacterium]
MTQDLITSWRDMNLPAELRDMLAAAKSVRVPKTRAELIDLTMGGAKNDVFNVVYDIPGKGEITEAVVHRCRNGVSVNYTEAYMRRRDPECMLIADDQPTDKPHYKNRFDKPFAELHTEIFEWLTGQDLIVLPFYAGSASLNCGALLIGPANAAFFAAALAEIQGMIKEDEIKPGFRPKAVIYLAPTFRHSLCDGKQVVVHHRSPQMHEIYSLNLYPGPSAKKGVYGMLLNVGEQEGWLTAHGSAVRVTTPYDNEFIIMHEGASGGGKSEMLQYPHREPDGRLLTGENIVNGKRRYIPLFQGCSLSPITDDMALCDHGIQNTSGKLVIQDAEEGWFVRVNHIDRYGVDQYVERLCTNPPEPLVFLNLFSVPSATCLIWEHTQDAPGKPCPNPRVILPRDIVPDIINEPMEVDVRSFGVRTPPCTAENPTYGIIGMLHILPPAIAWLWRLVAPRGFANPSITDTAGMTSEGVGSYWPFATGRRVDQANLLLRQIIETPGTRYTLIPNQHIGSWKVGFMPQWISREYMSRRGSAKFKPHQIEPARCSLLGWALHQMQIEGFFLNRDLLQVDTQPEVGEAAYDAGAKILTDFFKQELEFYLKEADLDETGRAIIECCMQDGEVEDYKRLTSGDQS